MGKKTGYQIAAVLGLLLLCGSVSIFAGGDEVNAQPTEQSGDDEPVSVYADSPDGKYRAETVGEESLGGWTYPELVQVRDLKNNRVMWSETSYMNPAFLWSESGAYLAVQSAGRQWTACTLVDSNTWNELPAPDVWSVSEIAEEFSDPYENGITAMVPLKWLSEDRLMMEVSWEVQEPSESYRVEGTAEYVVSTQTYENLDLHKKSAG